MCKTLRDFFIRFEIYDNAKVICSKALFFAVFSTYVISPLKMIENINIP